MFVVQIKRINMPNACWLLKIFSFSLLEKLKIEHIQMYLKKKKFNLPAYVRTSEQQTLSKLKNHHFPNSRPSSQSDVEKSC